MCSFIFLYLLFIKKSIADQIVVSGIPGLDREAAFEFVQKSKEVTKAIQDLGSERTALQELIRAQDFEEDL